MMTGAPGRTSWAKARPAKRLRQESARQVTPIGVTGAMAPDDG